MEVSLSDQQGVFKELERSCSMIEGHLERCVTGLRKSRDHATGPWKGTG